MRQSNPTQLPRNGRRASSINTVQKPGYTASLKENLTKKLMENHYKRRRILEVPDAILTKNPDKHFVYLNMNDMEKQGMWHEKGYQLYREDTGASVTEGLQHKFQRGVDGYVHRNEMVLAWIPKEEYEARQLEKEIIRGNRNIEDLIKKRPELADFQPTADATLEKTVSA